MKPLSTPALAFATAAMFGLVVAMYNSDKILAPDPAAVTAANRFTAEDKQRMQLLITANRFDCASVVKMRDMIFGGGFVVECIGSRGQDYAFNVADEGGRWVVTYKGFGQ